MARSRQSSSWTLFIAFVAVLSCLYVPAVSVKHEMFKTCDQSGFCKRNRAYADSASPSSSPYVLDAADIVFNNGKLQANVVKTTSAGESVVLPLTISFLESGLARFTLDEEKRKKGDIELRHDSPARKERYNEVDDWAIVGGLDASKTAKIKEAEAGYTRVTYGSKGQFEAIIQHSPLAVEFQRDGETHVKFNERGFLNFEHWRAKVDHPEGVESKEDESTWWDERFGGNTDSKPKGPESVALDISFPGYSHVFGVPEHAGPLSLKETRSSSGYEDPYRLFNADVFEYEIDSPMTLYGAIPFMQAHRKDSTVGVFWANAAETWIDIAKVRASSNPLSLGLTGKTDTKTHWISESGLLDVFVFLGPTSANVLKNYGELTGYTQLPQTFAIAYHQCRWNYNSDEDVLDVNAKFDRYDIPYDVIWLDIEYTDEKKYFTWDSETFGQALEMNQELDAAGRKLVAIIDPHIKNVKNYHVNDEMTQHGYATKNKENKPYNGHCWPGDSFWIDAFSPAAREWWKSLFTYERFKGTMNNVWIWNDMNEPSVFNGPEGSMPRDNLHHDNWEHRDLHNLNGLTFVNATYHAVMERKKGEVLRPFVLTRSFYSGSQRLGAMWTGDNQADWGHLAISLPMVLNQGVSGFPFAGADVGGFFGNPSKELLTRWYQAGAFYPFFRGHAHLDARRREPYLAGEPYTSIITQALRLRYSLLPAWYTAFHEASVNGTPIVRPQFYVHPSDEKGFAMDDQMYLGSTGLLVKPVVTEGASSVDIYIADDEKYYDYFDYSIISGAGKAHTVAAPLSKIPLLMQGGHIFPRRDRPRRSSALMKWDPYTLVVVVGKDGTAEGTLYVDDGETFDFQAGAYIHRKFVFDGASKTLVSSDMSASAGAKTNAYLATMSAVRIEKIVIVDPPSSVKAKHAQVTESADKIESKREVDVAWYAAENGKAAYAVVKDPGVSVGLDWVLKF